MFRSRNSKPAKPRIYNESSPDVAYADTLTEDRPRHQKRLRALSLEGATNNTKRPRTSAAGEDQWETPTDQPHSYLEDASRNLFNIQSNAESQRVSDVFPTVLSQATLASPTHFLAINSGVSHELRPQFGSLLHNHKTRSSIVLRKQADGYVKSKRRVTLEALPPSSRRSVGIGRPGSSNIQGRQVNMAEEDNTISLPSLKQRRSAASKKAYLAIATCREDRVEEPPGQSDLSWLFQRPPKEQASAFSASKRCLGPKAKKAAPARKMGELKGMCDRTVGTPMRPSE